MNKPYYLALYVDNSGNSKLARFLLKQYGFEYVEVRANDKNVPSLKNCSIYFRGLSGIKRFIWLRTPGIDISILN
jgi:hypothetical protein